MPLLVRIAERATELDLLFRMRHRVYVEQGHYVQATADGRVYDRFDAFPSTTNFVAYEGEQMVGGVRAMQDDGAGTHADDYYDFHPHLPPSAVIGSGSQLWVDEKFRGHRHIVPTLMNLSFYYLASRGVTHMVATVNPEVEKSFYRCGYQPVGPVMTHPHSGLPFRPVVLEISKIAPPIRAFIETQQSAQLLHSYNRVVLGAQERLFAEGEPSDAAFLVIEGDVEAITDYGPVALGPGQLVGELGVILGWPRSADIVSPNGALLLHIPKDELLLECERRPELWRALLRTVAERLYLATRTK